jgi:hypothetical protein
MTPVKEMLRRQMAEILLIEAPRDDWDIKTHIVFQLASWQGNAKSPAMLAAIIYKSDSEHTVKMIRDACRELCQEGILSVQSGVCLMMYRLHTEFVEMCTTVNRAVQH